MKRRLLFLFCLALPWIAVWAEPPKPGHSMQGEAFDEGPRQAAVLMEGTGDVHFPITTKEPLAQKFFTQGVGQLHGFWYLEAERSFRQVAAIDPDCAMAYWGMAMANINNPKRAGEFIKMAAARQEKVSAREKLWISSLATYYGESKKDDRAKREALINALEEISFEFPDDLEAKAFTVFQLWDNKQHGVPLGSRKAVDTIAREVLAANPMHPVHHYRIHLWNTKSGDKRALDSAARCGQAAPAIAHMWHMPGHTFSNLRRYADAAWQQEASARVDHAHIIASGLMPDQIHNFAHNNEWLVRDLGYIGRVHDAVDLAKNMIELPRLASGKASSYRMGRERLLDTLERFELWDQLAALGPTMYLASFDDPIEEVKRRRAVGLAWLGKADTERAEAEVTGLKTLLATAREERIAAADKAEAKAKSEKKSEEEIAKAMGSAMRSFSYRIEQMSGAISELQAARAVAAGNAEEARKFLAVAKDVPVERLSRYYSAIGDHEQAITHARDAAKPDDQQVRPLANLAHILWAADKRDEAQQTFQKLREISASLDLDVPAFARLAPIAAALQLPADWRIAAAGSSEGGARPDLATLGPFRWHPSPAHSWSLPDRDGKQVALSDYKGRAVLVVFYLGNGCAQCIEQLDVFAPVAKEFAEAGIDIVAVSTDSTDGLQETFDKAKDGSALPFSIVSDSTLQTFKAYRAFDDFEKIPLHGTFLVDRDGLLRWQDIGAQPFQNVKWLLAEAKRLLSITTSSRVAAATP